MKKLLSMVVALALLGGCATVCQHPEYKDAAKALLGLVQADYENLVAIAGGTADQNVLVKMRQVDYVLDSLGVLVYDIACPTTQQLQSAQAMVKDAQKAKEELLYHK